MSSTSTPPPPYSSRSSTRSSTSSKKHKSSSADKDKAKNRDKEKHNTTKVHKDSSPLREGKDEDALSVMSRMSVYSSTTASSSQSALDTLRVIAGNGVRRSKCHAEFLEELAKGPGLKALGGDIAERVKIITGKKGISFFRKFIGEELLGDEQEKKLMENDSSDAVVFAVCFVEAGQKVMDYYMTWKGKTRAKDNKGSQRRTDILDEEFRRVARTIDKEYKRVRHATHDNDDSRSHKSSKPRRRHSSPSPHRRSSLPPNIVVSPPQAVTDTPSPVTPTTGKRTSSANDSVISLPFLGAIRGVPPGNRLPLRVTNPDRNSLAWSSAVISEVPVTQVPPKNTSLETLVEGAETAENAPGDPERQASVDTLVQASDADQMLGPPKKETPRKRYAESISSAGSRSSRSSRSRKHRERSRSRKRSSSGKHHDAKESRTKAERKEHGHSSSSRHKDKDGDGDDHATRRHRHHRSSRHSSRHRDEREKDGGDQLGHKPLDRKRTTSSTASISSHITVVVLDPERVDQEMAREAAKEVTKGMTKEGIKRSESTWHGLSAPRHATKPGPTAVVTPWTGPLARASEGAKHIRPGPLSREPEGTKQPSPGGYDYDFDESDESDDWVEVKGMPPKPDPLLPPWPNRYHDSTSDSDSDPFSPPSPAPFGMKKLYGSLNPTAPVIPHEVPHYNPSAGADTYPTSPPVIPSSSFTTGAGAYGSPHRPVIPYGHGPSHTYSSSSMNHPGSTYGLSSPAPSCCAFSPGYIPPPPLTSPAASHHSLPPNTTYPPGFIPPPSSLTSPAGPNASLPGMHLVSDAASAAAHAAAVAHGNASPYLYSTPRPTASPYVRAWISPQPSMNASLPMTGSMTPGSTRGASLYAPMYGPSSSGTPPY